jgi:hypothetical protein
MKQQIKKWMVAAALLFAINASSQNSETAPWASSKGYWVIETNTKTPLHHTVRFYTTDDILVYTETLEGIRLNPERRKIKMKLKEALEAAVVAWQENRVPQTDKDYVVKAMR